MFYGMNVRCTICMEETDLRKFLYANGRIRLVGHCRTCKAERSFIVDMDTLSSFAHSKDNPTPTKEDHDFLHDLRVKWVP